MRMTRYSSWSPLYRWLAAVAVVLGVPMLPGRLAAQSWYNSAWANRMPVTIHYTQVSGTSSLVNFPVLVSVTNPNLKVGNGGGVGQLNGNDILFTRADGVTKLNHQLESYSAGTGQVIAWVQVPSLSAT